MSIGKKLLSLRQQRGLSQEELAHHLHVSRQTISKWESDLSLPDMKMALNIAEFYEIGISELLGLEEETSENSLKQIYEQTNIVLENIQKENKKRRILEISVIVMCLLCMVVSVALLIKVSKKQENVVINNNYHNNEVVKKISNSSKFKVNSYDLDNMMADVSIVLKVDGLKDNDIATLYLKDKDNQVYQYPMTRLSSLEFEYNGEIPITEYYEDYIILNQDGNNYKLESLSVDMRESIESFLVDSIHLFAPVENGKLIHNKVSYCLESPLKEINWEGLKDTKITFTITNHKNGEVLLNETIDYTKDTTMTLTRNIMLFEEIDIHYIIKHHGKTYDYNKIVEYVYSVNIISSRQLVN